jgi:hypothetical protein
MTDRPPNNYSDYLQLGMLLACQQCESVERGLRPLHCERPLDEAARARHFGD